MSKQKIGVVGSGQVGDTLSAGFLKHGYEVMRGSRDPKKLAAWQAEHGGQIGTFAEAAAFGELVVLAVKGTAALAAVEACGAGLDGKTVLDTTNPILDAPPDEGMLGYFTGPNESLIELLQKTRPEAHFVKCFSSVGSACMIDPDFGGIQPTMFICGNDPGAKEQARALLAELGWETEDLGGVKGGRAIEPLCITWCAPGFLQNRWNHAFKVLKKD